MSDRGCPQDLEAFKRAALPAFIALVGHSDPAEARKIFSELLPKELAQRKEKLDIYKDYVELVVNSLSKSIDENAFGSKKDDYIAFMEHILSVFYELQDYSGAHDAVAGLHCLFKHIALSSD